MYLNESDDEYQNEITLSFQESDSTMNLRRLFSELVHRTSEQIINVSDPVSRLNQLMLLEEQLMMAESEMRHAESQHSLSSNFNQQLQSDLNSMLQKSEVPGSQIISTKPPTWRLRFPLPLGFRELLIEMTILGTCFQEAGIK